MRILFSIFLLGIVVNAYPAKSPMLKDDHPQQYTVQADDDLWGVANKYLHNPWQWREVFDTDLAQDEPFLLYAGDVLDVVASAEGRPRIKVSSQKVGTVKLKPKMRISPLDQPIPTLPIQAVKPFLWQSRMVNEWQAAQAPYVVSIYGEHVTAGFNDKVYVRGIEDFSVAAYGVYRMGEPYVDPETEEVLGYPAMYIAMAEVMQPGEEVSVLRIRDSFYEVRAGDRILPAFDHIFTSNFYPRSPTYPVFGYVLSVLGDEIRNIGEYNSLALSVGARDGLQVGDVLAVMRVGEIIQDKFDPTAKDYLKLPDEYIGQILVYRVFEKSSFGLIMDSLRSIKPMDIVISPDELEKKYPVQAETALYK
jgi:hypothetical protein